MDQNCLREIIDLTGYVDGVKGRGYRRSPEARIENIDELICKNSLPIRKPWRQKDGEAATLSGFSGGNCPGC